MIGRATAFGFLLLAAAPAQADEESEAMLRSLVDAIEASTDWSASAGSIRSEGDDTIAAGLVFTRADPPVSLTIAELRLEDLAEGTDGGFTADSIELKDGALKADVIDYSVPQASVKEVTIPSVEGLEFDPHRLMTFIGQIYAIFAGAEFSDFSIPELSGTMHQPATATQPQVDMKIVYRNMSSTGLHDGVMETMTAGPLTVSSVSPDQGAFEFEIKSISAGRMDVAAAAHIVDEREYRDGQGDDIWRPIVSHVGYSGFSGHGPDGVTFKLDEVAIENIDGRQPEKPFAAAWDKILDPTISEDAKSDLVLEALRDMYSAWRMGTFRMEGLSVDAPAVNTAFSLGGITITGVSTDGIDSFILKAMKGKSPDGFGSLESLEFAGLVFPDIDALMKFAALESGASPAQHEETMRATFAALPRIAHFGMRGLVAGKSETDSVKMDLLSLDLRDWNEIFAESTEFRIEGVDVPRHLMELDAQTAQMVDALGFDRLVLGMSLRDRWAPGAGTDDATWTVTMKDAMDVELSYRLTGLTTDWVMAATLAAGQTVDSEAALMTMLNELGLGSATLKVSDRSLLDRGFGVAAQMQGLSVDGKAYREQMRGALPFLLSAAIPSDLAKMISEPLQAFMAGNQTLVAEMRPATPVPLLDIMGAANVNPMDLPVLLGLQLRSEAAP